MLIKIYFKILEKDRMLDRKRSKKIILTIND